MLCCYWLPADCGKPWVAKIYFISFYIVGVFAVLNLFVAVILDNFTFCANIDSANVDSANIDSGNIDSEHIDSETLKIMKG